MTIKSHKISAPCGLMAVIILSILANGNAFAIRNRFNVKPISAVRPSSSDIPIRMTASTISSESPKSSLWKKVQESASVMYKFSRPHTIKGTILASVMGVSRALIENKTAIDFRLIPKAIVGLLALLCGNAYIVGINQIYDVQIDEINKPFLPIAAKQLSPRKAWLIVLSCIAAGITIVRSQFSNLIFSLYMVGALFGTIYSVPPIQLKRFPVFAGGIIACVRGFLLNFGVYYAVREALGIPFKWNPVVAFISSFMTIFATVIAVTKDLPDVEGDVKYNIKTFAASYGVKNIAKGAAFVLSSTYGFAMFLPWIIPGAFKTLPMSLGHAALLVYFLFNYSKLEPSSMTSVKEFYKAIWNLFYLEYCLYPFI